MRRKTKDGLEERSELVGKSGTGSGGGGSKDGGEKDATEDTAGGAAHRWGTVSQRVETLNVSNKRSLGNRK